MHLRAEIGIADLALGKLAAGELDEIPGARRLMAVEGKVDFLQAPLLGALAEHGLGALRASRQQGMGARGEIERPLGIGRRKAQRVAVNEQVRVGDIVIAIVS